MRVLFRMNFRPRSIAFNELTGEIQAGEQTAAPRVFDKSNVQAKEAHVWNTKAKNQVHFKLAMVHSEIEEAIGVPWEWVAVFEEGVSVSLRVVHYRDVTSE